MKKRLFVLPALALLFGGVIAFSSVSVAQVRAEEEIVEIVEEEESESKYKELYDDAVAKIKEIKDSQFVSNLIATIVGGAGSMVVSAFFMFVNRDTMSKSLSALSRGEKVLSNGIEEAKKIHVENEVAKAKIESFIEKAEVFDGDVKGLIERCDRIVANQEVINKSHEDEINLLLAVISSSKELVANGTAEKLNKIYHK